MTEASPDDSAASEIDDGDERHTRLVPQTAEALAL